MKSNSNLALSSKSVSDSDSLAPSKSSPSDSASQSSSDYVKGSSFSPISTKTKPKKVIEKKTKESTLSL